LKQRHRFEVSFSNRQRKIRISAVGIVRWTRRLLRVLGWKHLALSLAVVDDRQMRRLHHEYLGRDASTDVLAFGGGGRSQFSTGVRTPFLGEVVVSIDRARKRAPEFGNRWDDELLLYLCHGILHLMGYRDSTRREGARMHRKEREVLEKVLGAQWRSKKRKRLF